ncbi:hypothetical protein BJ912DRAFT_1067871 [Pholiota molesta]|nr:hypothetical protein BJ912DRAFT_1067871 [Pholiota molesta]
MLTPATNPCGFRDPRNPPNPLPKPAKTHTHMHGWRVARMRLCPPTFSRSPDHWLIPPLPPVLSLAVVAPQPINTLQIPSLYGLQIPPTHRHSVAPHDTVQCIMSVERIARYCGYSEHEEQLPPSPPPGGRYQQYQQQPYQAFLGQQQQYPHLHPRPYPQQQPQPQPPASANSRYSVAEDEDDAYGGYFTKAAPAHGAEGALPIPFGGEEERREIVVQEEPRRVLKVVNE